MMGNKYIKYLPWGILGAINSYLEATNYARNSFDLFFLTLNFLIVYIAILVFCFSSSFFQKIPLPNSVLRMISKLFWLFQGSFALKYGKIVTKYTSRYQIKRGYL